MADLKKNLLNKFEDLKPEQKKKVVIGIIIFVFVLLTLFIYRGKSKPVPVQNFQKKEEIITIDDPKLLQQSLLEEQRKALAENKTEMDALRKRIEDFEKGQKQPAAGPVRVKTQPQNYPPGTPPIPTSVQQDAGQERAGINPAGAGQMPIIEQQMPSGASTSAAPYSYPQVPSPSQNGQANQQRHDGGRKQDPAAGLIGGIEVWPNSEVEKRQEKQESKKKATEKIYLPPSFMEATLLSGLAAQTTDAGKSNPTPVILRVANVAVLPNEVKANLKGCFVIGEGSGSLATERVDIRLTSLSCVAKDGKAVIDQKIKGFVVDADGNIGLAGKVVAKMGAMLSRSLLAGFFQGLGDAVKAASVTNMISPLGTTQTVNTNEIAKEAVGSGVSQAAHDLQKFYLDLAKNTLPVIEVGATKKVTVVVSEGIDLDVKSHCDRSNLLGGACSQSTEIY